MSKLESVVATLQAEVAALQELRTAAEELAEVRNEWDTPPENVDGERLWGYEAFLARQPTEARLSERRRRAMARLLNAVDDLNELPPRYSVETVGMSSDHKGC